MPHVATADAAVSAGVLADVAGTRVWPAPPRDGPHSLAVPESTLTDGYRVPSTNSIAFGRFSPSYS